MDNLTDNQLLTTGREMTSELIDYYLPILIKDKFMWD